MSAPAPDAGQVQAALAEMQALRADIVQAADAMLFAAESGLGQVRAAAAGEAGAVAAMERLFCAILEACAFQDLTGQRLTRIEALLGAGADDMRADAALMNGPALHGQGLDQDAADALFAEPFTPIETSASRA